MENIRIIFVLPQKYNSEREASEIMIQAYETCKQNVKTDVTWIEENSFESFTLNKTDFVVFEDFKGEVFENLKETKCARILGPWAISICLMEGKSIPNFPWPIYNVAMYNCIITCSNLPKLKKIQIKDKVEIMGGCYLDTLVEKITHLVTDNPKSEKYLVAAEAGVKLMCSSWIDAVWEASQSANIHANDTDFEEHKCLPFQNLHISCTGLTDNKRKEISKVIEKYGGKYSAKLNLKEADILVCGGVESTSTEKYKAARKRPNIKCVDIEWINESIAKGYAIPHNLFPVKKATSTPVKNQTMNPDFSVLSSISVAVGNEKTSIENTMNGTITASPGCFASPCGRPGPSKRKGNLKEDYGQLVDQLDVKKAKKAGHYLDGYSVYITGFNPEHTEKLWKILNLSGATRYEQFSERITHVIVGDPKFPEVKMIKSKGYQCSLVSVQWLLDSIDKEQPANEENYLLSTSDIDKSEFSSPLSRKGLNLLRTEKTVTEEDAEEAEKTMQNAENDMEIDIIQQYLTPVNTAQEDEDTLAQLLKNADNFPDFSNQVQDPPKEMPQFKPAETSTQQSTTVTQDETTENETELFFEGLKFLVIGFEDTHYEYIKELIENYSGQLVPKNYKGIPDFIVVPMFNQNEIRHTATEIVNELFVNECAKEGGLLTDICYYHRPLDVPDTNPLVNCVITISGYNSYERNFLKNLIEALGGYHQEQFSRVISEAKGVVASTHLISPKPTGKKYMAAVKWGLPAVNKDWLLECARTGNRVPEANFFVEGQDVTSENTPSRQTKQAGTPASVEPTELRNKALRLNDSKNDSMTKKNPVGSPAVSCSTPHLPRVSSNLTPDMPRTSLSGPGSSRILTPVNPRNLNFNDSTDKPFTQATPVNVIMKQYRESNVDMTPSKDSPERFLWMGIKTPETPLGACMVDNPSPQLRKQCELWLRQFPDYEPPLPRRLSTPLSEIKRKLWDKILKRGEYSPSFDGKTNDQQEGRKELNQQEESKEDDDRMDVFEPKDLQFAEDSPQNEQINHRLQQLEDMLNGSEVAKRQSRNFQSTIPIPEGSKDYKDSQACTVGWDYREQEGVSNQVKIFILTAVAETDRPKMVQQLESLGASVSDLSNYDPRCTHLLCPKPARNEKILSCMAAGKWILHTSYLEKSMEAGHLLNEEEFEFGNPKSEGKFGVKFEKDTETRIKAMHWWRKEVARRGYGAFNDMRAIVVAEKREPIIRVIEAGGGIVVDVKPPFDDTVHATHCLLEQRSVRDYAEYIPLAQQGVYLLNTVYISDYLHQPHKDVRKCILPYFAKYYC